MSRLKLHHQILIAMVLGAGVGLPLNIFAGERRLFAVSDQFASVLEEGAIPRELLAGFADQQRAPGESATLHAERAGRRWRISDEDRSWIVRRRGGELAVFSGGEWPRAVAKWGKRAGDLFLRLLSMIVAPLILTSLITGVTGAGSLHGLGRLGGRTLAYYLATSMLAIFTGILMFNLINPGRHANLDLIEDAAEAPSAVLGGNSDLGEILWQQLFNLIPANPFASLGDPTNTSILGVIFFALMFGVFITVVGGESGQMLGRFFSAGFDVMMRMTMFIIRLAPVGVLGFMLYAAAGKGLDVFAALGWYVVTVAAGLSIHAFLTLPLLLLLLARRSPWSYFQAVSPALLTGFSTASSNGTLPLTMTCVEKRGGISNRVTSFVLPLGATINMDGTALYEAAAVLFIGQVTGHELSLAQQGIVALTALLASIGAAGIPHAGTVMMVVVLSAVNLPLEGVGLILAVDRILDMYRTSVNIWSDTTACAVISRMEGETPPALQPSVAG